MRPGARLQAAVSLLNEILGSAIPADNLLTGYFRANRYIGSSDRRVISEIVYQILRRYEELLWYLQQSPKDHKQLARLLVLAYAHKFQGLTIKELKSLCKRTKENPFDLEPLAPEEVALLEKMSVIKPEDMPQTARLNIPPWLLSRLQATFGDRLEAEMRALNQPAPFDLRVNTLKATRERVLFQLETEGFKATPTPWSPVGVRLTDRRPLSGHDLWKKGEIEVQDEGSQLLAFLTDAQSGMAVLDYCAGAGGKTLAMAATMQNKGRIVATDTVSWRLNRSRERLRRAGVNNVEFRDLSDEATPKWLKRQAGRFDRVLVDAPCSGSGTWRRNPDLKLRFQETDLKELILKQQQILAKASLLVRPPNPKGEPASGGRLIYATCSLFEEENKHQVQTFLNNHPDFRLIPLTDIWSFIFNTPCPTQEEMLQLTPYTHNVDGFFIAVMERILQTK